MVNDMEDIVFIGFGGHAKSIADSINYAGKYNIVGYTDVKDRHCKYRYLGTDDALCKVFNSGVRKAVIGIGFLGNSLQRDQLVSLAKAIGFEFPYIIDPSATVANDAIIGDGCYIGKRAVVNADSHIGDFCIINTGAIIEHENRIGMYSHIAVGAILCGEITVGDHSFIGAGATIIQGRRIGNNCIIGANSTILADVDDSLKVYGIVRRDRP